MNEIIGGQDLHIWLGGKEYYYRGLGDGIFLATTVQDNERRQQQACKELTALALAMGYMACNADQESGSMRPGDLIPRVSWKSAEDDKGYVQRYEIHWDVVNRDGTYSPLTYRRNPQNVRIEPGTCMGSPNIIIGDSSDMAEAPANKAFSALGKHLGKK